jgi:flagellar basal-body rod protein FlgF
MPVFGPGFPSRVYAMTERPGSDMSPGGIHTTGRELDIAINGEGWMAVVGKDGQEAYTRAGDLRITPEGFLQTGSGLQVLGEGGPISIPPAEKVEIGQDGTISILPLGDKPTTLAVLDRIKLVKPELKTLQKQSDGLMYSKEPGNIPADADVRVISGALEGSNVNTIEAMVEMIELARNFELQTKVMKSANENSGISAKLMQMA